MLGSPALSVLLMTPSTARIAAAPQPRALGAPAAVEAWERRTLATSSLQCILAPQSAFRCAYAQLYARRF